MQLRTSLMLALFVAGAAPAQTSKEGLRSRIAGRHYPPLAEAARVQGDVMVKLNSGAVAVLRVFGRKTVKMALQYQCQEGAPPANDLKIAGAVIEIWIFGRTHCLQTNAATLVAQR